MRGAAMIEAEQTQEVRTTARELLRFLDEVMRAIARVDVGDAAAAAQLTLLEMRMLLTLAESGKAMALREIAGAIQASAGRSGQASDRLRGRGLVERAGGGRGHERAFMITLRGRQLIGSLEASRETAVAHFISGLGRSERLRIEGATHLLGRGLDHRESGMLAA
jgi:DNA-binding MarR family transcriptional regulator